RRNCANFTGSTTSGNPWPASSTRIAHSVADPCGSASNNRTLPRSARAHARNTALVVLAVPPLVFVTTIRTPAHGTTRITDAGPCHRRFLPHYRVTVAWLPGLHGNRTQQWGGARHMHRSNYSCST